MSNDSDEWDDVVLRIRQAGSMAEAYALFAKRIAETPRVEIVATKGQPTRCKVWRGGALVFAGRDYSADIRA